MKKTQPMPQCNTSQDDLRDDLPKYTGPHKPTKELEPYLKYLFPDVEDARSNIFFRYSKGEKFLSMLKEYLSSHVHPQDSDVTIVIENGANASETLDKTFKSLGIVSKRTSCVYNCYLVISESLEHSVFAFDLYLLIMSFIPPHYRNIVRSWGTADNKLAGQIVHGLANDQISQNDVVKKKPDFGIIPLYRLQLSTALGTEPVPAFIGEVARLQSADSLFMAVKSWLGGSKLLVDSVLAVNLWSETLSIVFYRFDCRVETLIELLNQYREDEWKSRCLRIVIRYKALRWLIGLQLIRFSIEHQHEDLLHLTAETRGQANELIIRYNDLLQGLGDTQTYTIAPEKGLNVSLDTLMRHQNEINDNIAYYEDILERYPQDPQELQDDEGNNAFYQAFVTVTNLVFDRSLSPAAVIGPVTPQLTVPGRVQVTIPVRTLVGFIHAEEVQLAANTLTDLVHCMPWDYTKLDNFSIQLPGIEWGWIENPEILAREKNTTEDELQQGLTHYLKGWWIKLRYLTWGALEDTLNARREENDQNYHQLDNMVIGTDRYLLELYRYLTHENAPDTRNSLKWAVRFQYYFQQVFQWLLNKAEQRARNEQAERSVTNRAARYERRVARTNAN